MPRSTARVSDKMASSESGIRKILVTGGAGYVGSALVPYLLSRGYEVRVLDLYLYGDHVLDEVRGNPRLEQIKADIRDQKAVREAAKGCDAVIHLACISNDPSFELDPALGKSINLDVFPRLVQTARDAGARLFIYASSSSIYGVKEESDVREDTEPEPLTDYSRFKLECEQMLLDTAATDENMTCSIIRPATVCGYASRMRLDLTVNILTIHALVNRKIRIFGGKQLRPNIHIKDMARVYELFLEASAELIHGITYNAGFENRSVEELARLVKQTLGDNGIEMEYVPTDDIRSYHINSDRIREKLGFETMYSIEDAVLSIARAYSDQKLEDPLNNTLFYNVKRMQELRLG